MRPNPFSPLFMPLFWIALEIVVDSRMIIESVLGPILERLCKGIPNTGIDLQHLDDDMA